MPWKYTTVTDLANAMNEQHMVNTPPDPAMMAEYNAFVKYASASGASIQSKGDNQAVFYKFLQDVKPPGNNFWDGTFLLAGQEVPKIAVFGAAAALLLLLLAKN